MLLIPSVIYGKQVVPTLPKALSMDRHPAWIGEKSRLARDPKHAFLKVNRWKNRCTLYEEPQALNSDQRGLLHARQRRESHNLNLGEHLMSLQGENSLPHS